VASPSRLQDIKTSEVESVNQKGPASPLLPSVVPVSPDNFVSQQPAKPHSVKKPIASENGKAAIKAEPFQSTPEVVVPKALPETEKSDRGKRYSVQSLGEIRVRLFPRRYVDLGFSIVYSVLSFMTVKPAINFLTQ
jgi:hypothetical protein